MSKDELEALADRVQGLSGLDTETDALIWCALRGVKYKGHNPSYFEPHLTQVEFTNPPKRARQVSSGDRHFPHAQPYTASVDAAMTLLDSNWYWRVGNDGEGADPSLFRADVGYTVRDTAGGVAFKRSVGAAPALALTAAALWVMAQ